MASTPVMTSCRWRCAPCGTAQPGFFYYMAADQAKNDRTCGVCGSQLSMIVGDKREERLFPFTSTHIDGNGTPITIENLHQMRQIERQYGVSLLANREDSPKDLPKWRPGGYDIRDERQTRR
jgi:hypothetical protein